MVDKGCFSEVCLCRLILVWTASEEGSPLPGVGGGRLIMGILCPPLGK